MGNTRWTKAGTITASDIWENLSAGSGAAISISSGVLSGGGNENDRAEFKNNTATSGHGGAVYINGSTISALEYVIFEGNQAKAASGCGGAIYYKGTTEYELNNLSFV